MQLRLLLTLFFGLSTATADLAPQDALKKAKDFYEKNKKDFPNLKYFVLIDYGAISSEKRFHIVDKDTGRVESHLTSHGRGSDPKFTGKAEIFGDEAGSKRTSLGFFKSAETYIGQHGYSLRLDGLSETNKNARARAIVIHAAPYVSENRKILGRSWGCPALAPDVAKDVIDKIKNGNLIYSFH